MSKITIINVELAELIEREMNKAELDQLKKDREDFAKEKVLIKEKQDADAAAKAALLEKLGITEQEAALLLGGN
jgi:hypothetical protein